MKTKFKFLTLAVATLLVGFTSCSNDDEGGEVETGTPKNMFIKISNDAPGTYAEGAKQAAEEVTFTSGDLFFTSSTGTILAHYTIDGTPTSATNINKAELAAGKTITNLPGNVKNVHVVGNTTLDSTEGNISLVQKQVLDVQSQGTTGNVVNLYGEATATPVTTGIVGANDLYKADIILAPTVARIELSDITATGAITGFDVEGIFIDNYYSEAGVDGTVAAAKLKDNNATDATDWVSGSTIYPTDLNPSIFDWYATSLVASGSPLAVKPSTTGNVWGYNVFATTAGSTVPRIIIRLNNITTTSASGLTFDGPQFITIKGLKDGTTPLTTIKAGEVYNIAVGALAFDETNITPKPNMNAIDVEVTVTVANWSVVNVTPEI